MKQAKLNKDLTASQLRKLYELLDRYETNLLRRRYPNLTVKVGDVKNWVADDLKQKEAGYALSVNG
jgi:hypothetical protein